MKENCSMLENGTRKSTLTVAKLDTSCSIRRSLVGGEASPRPHGKVSSSPLPVVTSERVLNRSKTGTIFDSGTRFYKCYRGTVLVSLVGLAVVSVWIFSDWNGLSLKCPLVATSGDPHGGIRSFELERKSSNSMEQNTAFEMNQNATDDGGEEFTDDKCWSRSRNLLYWPEDRRVPPSPALRRSLLDYEGLHARCTAGRTWKTGTDLRPTNAQGDCRYLIYMEGWEGLGNRILSLVSAFAFSLATNRVLLIDSRGHLQGLLCEPFDSSSWKLPQEFPYDEVRNFPSLKNVDDCQNKLGINLNLRHQQSKADQTFFCPETQERLDRVQWLAWNSNQYYIPRLFMIPSFWTKMNALFPGPPQAFSQLVRYLCLPSNPVWAKVERTYQAYLSSSQKLVGLQIRDHSQDSFSQSVYDKVVNCLLGGRILPNVSGHESALPAFSRQRRNRSDAFGTSIFVASLHRDYYEALRDFYLDHGTTDDRLVSVYTVANDGAEIYSPDQTVKAYIDIWLLSFSDTLVTSGWSTFGYVAQGLGGVPPYILDLHATSPPFCYIGQSIEPCNHYPFPSTCGATRNLSKEHEGWVHEHLRRCQDESYGLQIV